MAADAHKASLLSDVSHYTEIFDLPEADKWKGRRMDCKGGAAVMNTHIEYELQKNNPE